MSWPLAGEPGPVLLIHGGLADDIDAHRFWVRPGIVAALEGLGWRVKAPDRNTIPASWGEAAADMAASVDHPITVVAGSNGVSVALRIAIDHPALVTRLVLLWPATASDAAVDRSVPPAAAHLLTGETVRGVTDAELRRVALPVAVMASEPPDPIHQRHTADRLVSIVPGATGIEPGFPESPRPEFAARLPDFVAVLVGHL